MPSSSSLFLSSLELSDTKVYEPQIRARLGTASPAQNTPSSSLPLQVPEGPWALRTQSAPEILIQGADSEKRDRYEKRRSGTPAQNRLPSIYHPAQPSSLIHPPPLTEKRDRYEKRRRAAAEQGASAAATRGGSQT